MTLDYHNELNTVLAKFIGESYAGISDWRVVDRTPMSHYVTSFGGFAPVQAGPKSLQHTITFHLCPTRAYECYMPPMHHHNMMEDKIGLAYKQLNKLYRLPINMNVKSERHAHTNGLVIAVDIVSYDIEETLKHIKALAEEEFYEAFEYEMSNPTEIN